MCVSCVQRVYIYSYDYYCVYIHAMFGMCDTLECCAYSFVPILCTAYVYRVL